MTEQEAIKILSKCDKDCKYNYEGQCIDSNGQCFYAKELAIKALKKQIQVKPIIKIDGVDDIYLSCVCEKVLSGYDDRPMYCPQCGQKIDWGK